MLKLIIVMGFPNSGKTTLINALYQDFTGRTDWIVNDDGRYEKWRDAIYTINSKHVNIYFGLDGDDEDCVYGNIERIARKKYDIAIIPLSRSTLHYPTQAIRYVWEKWIDRSISNLTGTLQKMAFPDHERYYVHTLIPQLCVTPNYTGQISTKYEAMARSLDLTKYHIKKLLEAIVEV